MITLKCTYYIQIYTYKYNLLRSHTFYENHLCYWHLLHAMETSELTFLVIFCGPNHDQWNQCMSKLVTYFYIQYPFVSATTCWSPGMPPDGHHDSQSAVSIGHSLPRNMNMLASFSYIKSKGNRQLWANSIASNCLYLTHIYFKGKCGTK